METCKLIIEAWDCDKPNVCVCRCVCGVGGRGSVPARALSLLVSQTWTPLPEPTASKPEAVGWKSSSSSRPSPGLNDILALTGCSSPGSHTRHTFTCSDREKSDYMLMSCWFTDALVFSLLQLYLSCSSLPSVNISFPNMFSFGQNVLHKFNENEV